MTLVREMSYGTFSESLYDKTYAACVPSHGHFEITFACALKCGFCYCTCYTSPAHLRKELSTEEIIRILDEAISGGCLWLTFSGGDPFIRPDFREIYSYAVNRGVIVSIFCSGLIMTDSWIEHLRETRPLKIELPFYGVTAATYEALSGKAGSFERALANVRKMLAAGLPVKLKTKVTRQNLHEVADLQRFIEWDLGLEFHPNYYVYPRLDDSRDHLIDRLSPEEIKALDQLFTFESCDSGSAQQAADEIDPRLFRCAACINTFYVNPYGELNFCTYVRASSFDLRRGSIREGVDTLRRTLLTKTQNPSSPCASCHIQSSCQNCPGHAVLETGMLDGRSEYLCDVNHALRGTEC